MITNTGFGWYRRKSWGKSQTIPTRRIDHQRETDHEDDLDDLHRPEKRRSHGEAQEGTQSESK